MGMPNVECDISEECLTSQYMNAYAYLVECHMSYIMCCRYHDSYES